MLVVTTLECHFYSNGNTAGNTAEASSEAEEPRTLIPTAERSLVVNPYYRQVCTDTLANFFNLFDPHPSVLILTMGLQTPDQ